ncbi:MAG: phosphotransferase family protein [Candidatus Hodarchaeales archaeon]
MSSLRHCLDYDEIEAILEILFPQGKIEHIEKMQEGIGEEPPIMVRISLKNPHKDLILRILHPKSKMLFERELGFIFYAKRFNLCPVPNVLFFDNSKKLIQNDYYIYEFVEEETLAKTLNKLSVRQQMKLYREIGRILGTMHSHRKEHLGDVFFDGTNLDFVKRKNQSLHPKIEEDYNWLLENDFAEDQNPAFVRFKEDCEKLFEKYHEIALDRPRSIGFTHNDLSTDNLIVDHTKVSALIDFSEGGFSDVDWELARCERRLFLWIIRIPPDQIVLVKKAFFEGYQTVNAISAEYSAKKPLFFLIQIMDDMGMFPEFSKRLNAPQLQQLKETLCWEMETLIKSYRVGSQPNKV